MLKKAIILISVGVSFCTQATPLLTKTEQEQVSSVREQFNDTAELQKLTKVNSSIFTLTNQTSQLKASIVNERKAYQEYQQKLSKEMLSGTEENTNYYFESMKKTSNKIKTNNDTIHKNTALVTQYNAELEKLNHSIRQSKNVYSDKLTAIKNSVVTRIKTEFSKPLPIKIEGKLQCSPYESIRACFESKQTTSKLVNDAIESRFGQIDITSSTNQFTVNSASMDFEGNVDYNVSFNLFVQYNEQINAQIMKEVGINSFDILLVSNKDAVFYIDGLPVGNGNNVSVKVSKGKYSILAKFDDKQESSIQSITSPVSLTYNFSS
ncbi:hypothetical protein C9J48_22405 [Photobacterium profundum]|uniref:PEGA domain-containing protein n=1 Tax=Photobacterium profundum 3TCK TaxID=314280 RepID=Q1YZB9_9GAMM|nr:hypothetical protein [Photobacterium profundum]EAS41657.1 hypothetical protein P3TCK_19580 [Photobacterium profundum 3TCK]PSV59741.1 hypothetical protein C9J48_22405 [Photobacterium profundum]